VTTLFAPKDGADLRFSRGRRKTNRMSLRLFVSTLCLAVFVFGFAAPAESLASSSEDEKLEAVLAFVFKNEAAKFGWPANYKSLWCPTNVFNLLRRLDEASVDLSGAKVWYIIPPEHGAASVIHPRAARSGDDGPVSEWGFHVVVELEGRILDLDFTSRPDVESIVDYAAVMWHKGPLAVATDGQPLLVREIPALDYLTHYRNNWDFYINDPQGLYPATEMSDLLPKVVSTGL
jgi:hypothetical protein